MKYFRQILLFIIVFNVIFSVFCSVAIAENATEHQDSAVLLLSSDNQNSDYSFELIANSTVYPTITVGSTIEVSVFLRSKSQDTISFTTLQEFILFDTDIFTLVDFISTSGFTVTSREGENGVDNKIQIDKYGGGSISADTPIAKFTLKAKKCGTTELTPWNDDKTWRSYVDGLKVPTESLKVTVVESDIGDTIYIAPADKDGAVIITSTSFFDFDGFAYCAVYDTDGKIDSITKLSSDAIPSRLSYMEFNLPQHDKSQTAKLIFVDKNFIPVSKAYEY